MKDQGETIVQLETEMAITKNSMERQKKDFDLEMESLHTRI